MRLGIDASNSRAGGGLTYLIELLSHGNPAGSGINEVIIWASYYTLSQLPDKSWLVKRSHPLLNISFFFRIIWQKFYLSPEAVKNCDILFLPSGNTSGFHPYISMCQNLLPFESEEKAHYGFSLTRLRYELLKWNQCRSFRNADGVIFLSNYSIKIVEQNCGNIKNKKVIHHGVSELFRKESKNSIRKEKTLNILYVSIINFYKHQDKVVRAVYELLDKGFDIKLTLIGPSYKPALKKLRKVIDERPEYAGKIILKDKIAYKELPEHYEKADVFVFASSCETFGMILLEAMSGRVAIACSSISSMPEIAADTALYFNPLNVKEIESAIRKYLDNPDLRNAMSEKATIRSLEFSWEKCSEETFSYIQDLYNRYSI